jgi:branched-chain amino acid transport system permease protein
VFGTLIAVIFVQGFLIEGLRFLGDWRNLLFGALILLAMNVRPRGLIDAATIAAVKRMRIRNREPGNARTQGAE